MKNLNELINYQEGLYAVKDIGIPQIAKQNNLQKYYNSGVLWIDVKNWVQKNCQDKIILFIERNKEPLLCPDQDILNIALKEIIRPLPREYNLSEHFFIVNKRFVYLYFYYKKIKISEVKNAIQNKKIIHFYGLNVKPWTDGNLNPFNETFSKLMTEVNPNFIKESLSEEKKIFTDFPKLYYDYLLIENAMNTTKRILTKSKF